MTLAVESVYEYGSRAGIWRLFRVFDNAKVPITVFATAVALERNPAVGAKMAKRGDEAVGHGYRWSNGFEMTREEEREAIKLAVESIKKTTGSRPSRLVLSRDERKHPRINRRGRWLCL